MQVVLKKSLANLGKKGDAVKVQPGYARNFLIPRGLALPASETNLKQAAIWKEKAAQASQALLKKLHGMREQISRLAIKIEARADESGHLYGSIGKREIQKALEQKISLKVPQTKIDLGRPIKKIGEYVIGLKLEEKNQTKFSLVIPAKKEKEEAKK